MSTLPTCIEPGSVPGQNCVDLEPAVCWLNWDWKDPPMNWVPADKETNYHVSEHGMYLLQLLRKFCRQMHKYGHKIQIHIIIIFRMILNKTL